MDEQHRFMTTEPIPRVITTLAIPTIISMLVTSIYNLADTFFVSRLGTSASGAVGIVFSLMAIIQAVGFTFGLGAGSQVSRLLGAREDDRANEIAVTACVMAAVTGCILAVCGVIWNRPLMHVLGATDTILPYACDYARYIFLAAPFMMLSFVLNNLLRSEGKARFAMLGLATGGLLNIVLDPLFIFRFSLGISGAAIATGLSQCLSCFILLHAFTAHKTTVRLGVSALSKDLRVYLNILRFGFPSLCRQGLGSLAAVLLNKAAFPYGDAAIAAMTIVTKTVMTVFSALIGFMQGYQPVLGYNYGAKLPARSRQAFIFTFSVCMVAMIAAAAVMYIFAPYVVCSFVPDDPLVAQIGTRALRLQCLAMPFMPLTVICNMSYQTIGKSFIASLLSAGRQGIFFIPLILTLPKAFGVLGLQLTQPIADLFTFMLCLPFAIRFLRAQTAQTNDPNI